MEQCFAGYNAEINRVSQVEWDEILAGFSDAKINQCWGYGSVKWGAANSEHVVLKDSGSVRALAQVAIIKPRLAPLGIAYVAWGPVWKRREVVEDGSSLRAMLEALKDEYVIRRRLVLRIRPYGFEEVDLCVRSIFEEAGFRLTKGIFKDRRRTILVDLRRSAEEMRKHLSKSWRNCLTNSEKEDLRIVEAFTTDALLAVRLNYEVLMTRKNFQGWDLCELARIQDLLAAGQKMRITTCEDENGTIAASVCSALGEVAVGLIGTTSDIGRRRRAYYLLQWDEILWAKRRGMSTYDFNGVNPEKNPTVYHFKSGFRGDEVTFVGVFDYYPSPVAYSLLVLAERVLGTLLIKGVKGLIKRVRRTIPAGKGVVK